MQKATRQKARKVLDVLLDPYLSLGMTYLLPLLECINTLVKFAQSRNVFICDFVGALTICQAHNMKCIWMMVKRLEHISLLTSSKWLSVATNKYIKWDLDMNDSLEVLAFTVGSRILPTRHDEGSVSKEAWSTLVADVKVECSGISDSLIVFIRLNGITFYFVCYFLTLV
jgi:hypothetical protein